MQVGPGSGIRENRDGEQNVTVFCNEQHLLDIDDKKCLLIVLSSVIAAWIVKRTITGKIVDLVRFSYHCRHTSQRYPDRNSDKLRLTGTSYVCMHAKVVKFLAAFNQ